MHCHDAQQNLDAAVDRELTWRERAALRAHLVHCATCRAGAQAVRDLSHRLATLPAPAEYSAAREAVRRAARGSAPSPTRPLRRLRRLALAAGGGVLVVALALLLTTRPSPAMAEFRRVAAAEGEVQSAHWAWHITQPETGAYEENETWYADGKFRMESRRDGKLTEMWVYDGEKRHYYDPAENRAYLNVSGQPFGTPFRGFTVEAMLKVKQDADVESESVRGPDGRTLTRFTITDRGLPERSVVDADSQTHLPVHVELWYHDRLRWRMVGESDVIEYDAPVDPKLFLLEYPAEAEVVDRSKGDLTGDEAAWEEHYDQGSGRGRLNGEEIIVRDVQVVRGGDVYVIWSGPDGHPGLADTAGTVYYRTPSSFYVPDDRAAQFLVAEGQPPHRTSYTLTLSSGGKSARIPLQNVRWTDAPDPVYPTPTSGHDVGYLYQTGAGHAAEREFALAQYWDEEGKDPQKAVRHTELAVELERTIKGRQESDSGHWHWIGRLYEKAGRREKAREYYRRAVTLLEGEVNDPNHHWQPGAVEKVRKLYEDSLKRVQ